MIASPVITTRASQHQPAPTGDTPTWAETESSLRRVYASVTGLGTPHALDAMVSPPDVVVTDSVSDPSGMAITNTHVSVSAVPHCKGGGHETAGGDYRRFPVATLGVGGVIGVTWRVSLRTASPRVAFCLGGTTAANYRFLVRVPGGAERYVSKAGTAVRTDSFVVLDFGSSADRIVSVENQDTSAFRAVNVDTGHDATNPNEPGIALFPGDRPTNASRGPALRCDSLVHFAAELLALRNPWASGVGSTRYVATSYGTRHKLAERIEADIGRAKEIDAVVKVLVLTGSNESACPASKTRRTTASTRYARCCRRPASPSRRRSTGWPRTIPEPDLAP